MTDKDQYQQLQPLSLTSIRIGSTQPKVLAEFYEKFFGRPADFQYGDFHVWQGPSCQVRISDHSEIAAQAKEPGRILLNFDTPGVKEEFERLKALGVTIIREPYVMEGGYWVATLADPDGNLVQLTNPAEFPTAPK